MGLTLGSVLRLVVAVRPRPIRLLEAFGREFDWLDGRVWLIMTRLLLMIKWVRPILMALV